MFDAMFNEDKDFERIQSVAPVQINDLKDQYRAKFEIVVDELKHFVLKRSEDKKEEINSLMACINGVMKETDSVSVVKIKEFMHNKKGAFKIAHSSRNANEIDEALNELRDQMMDLSDYLMNSEMILVEQFEVLNFLSLKK
jgi:hypothetical protein